ncbi:hypothetical protein R3W88_004772 [Solanum pinnatisectum]|uniref:Ubiquitin-like protease family profile domain-containing protein n=1 Tax=Solanum pinnatisectum TaxID=50273 RepID=A0AAV9KAD1_9SOLN|nr:hypothetical protein R3W88_004772 [Solanum pinnatisectum]
MITTQSFIGAASSSNIKCYFCLCEECEQQHDYFISRVKELADIFKEMTCNIDVHTSKKISQPLKCRRLKKSISQSLSIIKKEKEKEKVKKKAKEKEKKKEKKVEVFSCDVKQQYPFEGFNIDDEGPTKLMSSFSQWINEGLYKHHAKNVVFEYEKKIVGTIKGFGISDRTNWSVLESYQEKNKSHPFEVRHVTGIAQHASNSLDCGLFVAAYVEFLSDGLQVPSYGIISETLRMRYASLLWNYGILKARSGYVSNNEDPQRPRPKKAKFDENVVVTTIY